MNNNIFLSKSGIVSKEIKRAVFEIINILPSAVFGGSIALNAVGLISRSIGDIDIFLPERTTLSQFLMDKQIDITSDTVTDMNGKEIQRTGVKIGDVKVCVFKVDDEELKHSCIDFFGRKIKIQNINSAIIAKRTYADKNGKHKKDLEDINRTLNNLL